MIQFSVIIPNFNHGKYLKDRIDSVLKQSCDSFELIIIDDASIDNSREIIETYRGHPRISHILYEEKNSGSAFAHWQTGIKLAKADWIWIAESDDLASPLFLETAAKMLTGHPDAGLFYCDSEIIDKAGNIIGERFSTTRNRIFSTEKWTSSYFAKGDEELDNYLKFDCTVNNSSSAVFKKSLALDKINLLPRFRYYGDWFFFIKLSQATNIIYSNQALNFYRKHSDSHLHKETSLLISRMEYFTILKCLYDDPAIHDKKKLADHFALWYLGFGIIQDGAMTGLKILRYYFKTDKKLFFITIRNLALIKLFRKKISRKISR